MSRTRRRPAPAPGPPANPAALHGFRPLRVALWAGALLGGGLLVDALSSDASFGVGLALVFFGLLLPVAMPQTFRLLGGSVSHTYIGVPPFGWSDRANARWRAAVPSGTFALCGLYVLVVTVVVTGGGDGAVPATLVAVGAIVLALGVLGMIATAASLHPRFLVPATMREDGLDAP